MRTKRITNWCYQALQNGDMDTEEIKDFINERSRHGATSHGLANVLSRDRRFSKVGERYRDRGQVRYKVAIWSLNGGAVNPALKELTNELKKELQKNVE